MRAALWLFVVLTSVVPVPGSRAADSISLVVTTSILEQAVRELGSAAADVDVVRLIPPGSCPGHFDLSPRSLPALRSASAIVRHEFQGVLEQKLLEMGVEDATVVVADAGGSLLVPSHYGRLVRQVGDVVAGFFPDRRGQIEHAVTSVVARMAGIENHLDVRSRPWEGAPVIASFQQAEFSRWLGLELEAVIGRPEDTSPRELESLLDNRPAMVVANLQEGLEAAENIARRLGVPLVVFSNFPGADGYGVDYDDLVKNNLGRLDAAWRQR